MSQEMLIALGISMATKRQSKPGERENPLDTQKMYAVQSGPTLRETAAHLMTRIRGRFAHQRDEAPAEPRATTTGEYRRASVS